MKKFMLLLLCGFLLMAGSPLSAETQRKKPEPVPALSITRNAQDPTILTLSGEKYLLFKSVPNELEDRECWFNVYTLNGDESEEQFISVIKIENAQSQEIIKDENMDDYLTFDARNPKDIIASMNEDGNYVVTRFIQVNEDVFSLMVAVPEEKAETLQTQKQLFRAVRNTPTEVITAHFVQTVCRFGSDCRMD